MLKGAEIMIKGLYETHLPVSDLNRSIPFYESLGLTLYRRNPKTAFLWIIERQSWLGLWEGEEYQTKYHPSLRHLAFKVEISELKKAIGWLNERGISPREDFDLEPIEPIVFPPQAHSSIYFNDPDGNSLEFIASLPFEVPNQPIMYLSEWEKLTGQIV
jgi:catechol 2,3-dioxygenase-like lactoylglutathione lyase family enzyme